MGYRRAQSWAQCSPTFLLMLLTVLGPVLFNIFINDLDEEVQGTLTKLSVIANTLEDRNKLQSDLDRLEHRAENNRMKFNSTSRS